MSCGHLAEIGLPQDDPSVFNVDANNVLTLVYNIISSKSSLGTSTVVS